MLQSLHAIGQQSEVHSLNVTLKIIFSSEKSIHFITNNFGNIVCAWYNAHSIFINDETDMNIHKQSFVGKNLI